MSEHNIQNTEEHAHDEHAGLSKSKIWQVFFILLGITVVEFIIALVILPKGMMGHTTGNVLYILLTILKAYYIVAYFMHLKFEKTGLQLALGLAFIFIIYFIVLMLIEGGYLHLHMSLHP
ncbi:cytochrome C oxidase subunit IV family protein [Pedobacter antarcticus]|uniref:Caa(3)-type oxidase n=2 Tax=Pedobacter antarcticus TaxID=34086 RepID=A0A081PGU7_9SPHI|nr:cytochrome C oxidase subunit IV family protein [Pedobacter antarcticus]KEQ29920.1 caa(3)-type oxidase [Pedobacter antarcticus 4BY]SDL98457.1 caa(3)-type oxidase, subunit IV [Pedobacter antarcticus]SFE79562.1 caa(3)-type oxidase, subunit IV [Pedobacter antarcticus]